MLAQLSGSEDTSSPSPNKVAVMVTPSPSKAFSRVRLDTWIFCALHQVRKEGKKRQRKVQEKKRAAKKLDFEVSFFVERYVLIGRTAFASCSVLAHNCIK